MGDQLIKLIINWDRDPMRHKDAKQVVHTAFVDGNKGTRPTGTLEDDFTPLKNKVIKNVVLNNKRQVVLYLESESIPDVPPQPQTPQHTSAFSNENVFTGAPPVEEATRPINDYYVDDEIDLRKLEEMREDEAGMKDEFGMGYRAAIVQAVDRQSRSKVFGKKEK